MSNAKEGVRVAALAKEDLGIKHRFKLLLDQPRLGGAGLLVVAEEARKSFWAVAVASSRSLEIMNLNDILRFELSKRRRDVCR